MRQKDRSGRLVAAAVGAAFVAQALAVPLQAAASRLLAPREQDADHDQPQR
jgi:hypothetical protein